MSDSLRAHKTAACQAPLSFTISWFLLKLIPIQSEMLSNHFFLCLPLLLLAQSFSAVGSFLMNRLFASGDQSIGASTSALVLPVNIQGWFPLGLTSLISLQSKGVSRVLSSTTVGKHQFFSAQPFYGPALTFIHDYWKNRSFDYTDLCWQKDICIYVCIRR